MHYTLCCVQVGVGCRVMAQMRYLRHLAGVRWERYNDGVNER